MKWQQITVTTTTEGSDLVSSVLYDYGSDGVSIADKNDVLALIKERKIGIMWTTIYLTPETGRF